MSKAKPHLKKLRIRGLKRRWMKTTLLVILIIVVLLVAAYSVSVISNTYSTVRDGLYAKARTATDFFANYITRTYAEYYDSAYMYIANFDDANKLELQFINTNGRIELSSHSMTAGTAPGTSDITEALETGEIRYWQGRNESTGEHLMAVSAPMTYAGGQVIGVMRYVTSLKLVDSQIRMNILMGVAAGAAVMLLVALVSMVFLQSVVEPVREITAAAKQMASGSYGIQIGKKYRDEIGDMVDAINEMSIKISQSEKAQTEFVSSVSHELRTPLTAITGWGETLIYNDDLDEETKRGIGIILKEARRLTKMVEELLEFTRMQDGRFTLNAEQMDVAAELEDSIFAYRELLKQDDMHIDYEPCDEELPLINGDPARLRQVFYNIFDNAAKYARDGKRITVSTSTDGDNVFIRMRDFGPGIPEDELERVKMKFYKGSSKERGSGIGLAVCDEIIKYHGGDLTLSNAEGGGTLVTIRIPIEPTFGV
ncbi:MAG: ATP-binding protein [Oscillospiraceae bacterium]